MTRVTPTPAPRRTFRRTIPVRTTPHPTRASSPSSTAAAAARTPAARTRQRIPERRRLRRAIRARRSTRSTRGPVASAERSRRSARPRATPARRTVVPVPASSARTASGVTRWVSASRAARLRHAATAERRRAVAAATGTSAPVSPSAHARRVPRSTRPRAVRPRTRTSVGPAAPRAPGAATRRRACHRR